MVLAYIFGVASANKDLGTENQIDKNKMYESVYKETAGLNFEGRLAKDLADGTDINNLLETETHRCYCEGQMYVADLEHANKTWVTMLDEKVRESHQFLEGVTIPYNEMFYTVDDSAFAPGGFTKAELNCGCRCEIVLSAETI